MKTLLLLWGLLGPFCFGFPEGAYSGFPGGASGAGPGFEEAVVFLSGASCVEDLSEEVFTRYEALAAHPLNLNVAGRSRLLSSGLLTPFQVASLMDYRSRTGAILSWAELALVDGFSAELVAALRVFAVLGLEEDSGFGRFVPGRRESLKMAGSVTLRGAARAGFSSGSLPGSDASWSGAGGFKLEAAAGERAALFFSARNTLSDSRFSSPTFSAAYYGRRALGQVVVGHFQARFGQGLVLWSGFSLSGYSSVGAFRRNGNGFAPTGSYSPTLLGVATDWHFGSWRLSAGYSFGSTWKDLGAAGGSAGSSVSGGVAGFFGKTLPILNLTWTGRTATLGVTATSRAAGFEARWSLPGGLSLFSEVATNWASGSGAASDSGGAFGNWLRTVSAVAGTAWVPAYGHKWALLGRWLGPDAKQFSGLALGYAGPSLESTLDLGVNGLGAAGSSSGSFAARGGQLQIKSVTQWKPVFAWDSGRLQSVSASAADTSSFVLRPQLRLVARWRPEDSPAASSLAISSLSSSSLPATKGAGYFLSSSGTTSSNRLAGLRLEMRGALAAEYGHWTLGGRYDAVWYRGFAWNWYAEAGFRTDALKLWLRGGLFKVDDWDDRIYVYERDAPGSFTVPARCGRGWNASLYAAWQFGRTYGNTSAGTNGSPATTSSFGSSSAVAGSAARRFSPRHGLWLRIETVQYPWNLSPKPGRLEARLQYRLKW